MELYIDIKLKHNDIEEWDTLRCDLSRGNEYILGSTWEKIRKLHKLVKEIEAENK